MYWFYVKAFFSTMYLHVGRGEMRHAESLAHPPMLHRPSIHVASCQQFPRQTQWWIAALLGNKGSNRRNPAQTYTNLELRKAKARKNKEKSFKGHVLGDTNASTNYFQWKKRPRIHLSLHHSMLGISTFKNLQKVAPHAMHWLILSSWRHKKTHIRQILPLQPSINSISSYGCPQHPMSMALLGLHQKLILPAVHGQRKRSAPPSCIECVQPKQ